MPKKNKQPETSSDSDSGPDDKQPPPQKKAKGSSPPPTQWTLEKLRQVRINEFRGKKMVDIREFYEKNGEILPGKKGISLSITQWKKLLEISKEVDQALED